ncbi:MAG: hypothetical protein ACLPJH_05425 [Myxococcaceae bacterium]
MSVTSASWLTRPEREAQEQPAAMLDALGLLPGQTVADVGAGRRLPRLATRGPRRQSSTSSSSFRCAGP